jgi:hypothetical protein
MAINDASVENVTAAVDSEAGADPVAPQKFTPSYKVISTDEKIVISKDMGKIWKGRKDAATTARKTYIEAADEAIRYFNHDQLGHRTQRDGASGNTWMSRRKNESWTETENVVFANIKAVTPSIYAKNPKPEFTAFDPERKDLAEVLENVIYTLSAMDAPPGLNLKITIKQAVVHAQLTNCAWVETGWVFKQDSSEQALTDLRTAAEELDKAKDEKAIRAAEGKLQAIENKVSFLLPSGPWCRFHPIHRVYCDPAASMPDFSDALWMMIEEYYPTDFLNAQFGGEKDSDGKTHSLYKPTHVLNGDVSQTNTADDKNFKLFNTGSAPETYGYNDKSAMKAASYTKCWRIWDKTTRRIFLYSDDSWTWPVWVWNDKLHLPRFFPLRNLGYHMAAFGAMSKGEVTYYLDQQDAVNEINSELQRARWQVFNKLFYDATHLNPDDVDKFLGDPKRQAMAIKVPEGKNFEQVFFTFKPPSLSVKEVFDKGEKLEAINRISGTGVILRNEQFKTNTTNEAINKYEASTQTFLDEKIDAVEDFLGGVYADVAHLCLQFLEQPRVAALVGQEQASKWVNMPPEQIASAFGMRVVGGSTQKPSSGAKRKEALEISKIAGQFGAQSPTVIAMVLRLWSKSFDQIEMRTEDWDRLQAEFASTAGGGGGAPAGDAPPNGAGPPGGAPGGGPPPDAMQRVAAMIDGMPPAAKQALGVAMSKGVPIMDALREIMKKVQQAAPPGTNPPTNGAGPPTGGAPPMQAGLPPGVA